MKYGIAGIGYFFLIVVKQFGTFYEKRTVMMNKLKS
ncbi:hypothetical protein Bcoa_0717 [Heyndrickxia coagulans 36D1]|jgi:hypothetical protein|uniref:Uncharacterized protein n=1 Tax=Heyndrickxia coagulans 36D1 TaxID=345219 RepID=G2TQT8_HEYCO|nr:hypothetical protein Bcoa_0717 [Heyndrickxia coagulans 36D1]